MSADRGSASRIAYGIVVGVQTVPLPRWIKTPVIARGESRTAGLVGRNYVLIVHTALHLRASSERERKRSNQAKIDLGRFFQKWFG
jgi:hypothetical protein